MEVPFEPFTADEILTDGPPEPIDVALLPRVTVLPELGPAEAEIAFEKGRPLAGDEIPLPLCFRGDGFSAFHVEMMLGPEWPHGAPSFSFTSAVEDRNTCGVRIVYRAVARPVPIAGGLALAFVSTSHVVKEGGPRERLELLVPRSISVTPSRNDVFVGERERYVRVSIPIRRGDSSSVLVWTSWFELQMWLETTWRQPEADAERAARRICGEGGVTLLVEVVQALRDPKPFAFALTRRK